jgi:hypothetical protein
MVIVAFNARLARPGAPGPTLRPLASPSASWLVERHLGRRLPGPARAAGLIIAAAIAAGHRPLRISGTAEGTAEDDAAFQASSGRRDGGDRHYSPCSRRGRPISLARYFTRVEASGGDLEVARLPLPADSDSKPAVPLAGKYRLVDIPISNCINSQLRRSTSLAVPVRLAQSASAAPTASISSPRFRRISPPSRPNRMVVSGRGAQTVHHFLSRMRILILSGDQLYAMDSARSHRCTRGVEGGHPVAATPVTRGFASSYGILRTDASDRRRLRRGAHGERVLDELALPPATLRARGIPRNAPTWR